MTQRAADLLANALTLSDAERGDVVAGLIDSLDPGEDTGAVEAWGEEIKARLDEVRSGRVTPVPWAEARRQILADDDDAG